MTEIMLCVRHKGRIYRKGWHAIHITVAESREFDELKYLAGRFLKEIKREIEHYDQHRPTSQTPPA